MRIIFMGSAPLASTLLRALIADGRHDLVAVVTQPDRPKGRRLQLAPCETKLVAQEYGFSVLSPEDVNSPESLSAIRDLSPELVVIVAYGQLLKAELLALSPGGFVNVHASLLPKYRGAAPIQWAIVNGDDVTGVTTMYINERMDAGDIIMQDEVVIDQNETAGTLHDKLAEAGAELLVRTLHDIQSGQAIRTAQNDDEATLAPKLTKADGKIDWTQSAVEIYNRVRGFNPWPVCWAEAAESKRLRVLKVRVEDRNGAPGGVIDITGEGPVVGTGHQSVLLLEVQPDGKKVMSAAAYLSGHDVKIGDLLI